MLVSAVLLVVSDAVLCANLQPIAFLYTLPTRWAIAFRVLAHTLEYARVLSEYARGVRSSMLEYTRVRLSMLE